MLSSNAAQQSRRQCRLRVYKVEIERLKCGSFLIPVIRQGDKRLWPIRAICKQLNIDWRQHAKELTSYTPVRVSVVLPEIPGIRSYECLEQKDFERWLHLLDDIEISGTACKRIRQLKYVVLLNRSKSVNAPLRPGDILNELAWSAIQNFSYRNWHTLHASIERDFNASYGCSFYSVTAEDLGRAINNLCEIIFNLYNPKPLTKKEHLDALFKRLVSTVGYGTAQINSGDIEAITSTLEQYYAEHHAWRGVSDKSVCESLIQHVAEIMAIEKELLDAAIRLFDGNQPNAEDWLRQPIQSLGGLAPTDVPLRQPLDLIGKLEHGGFV